MLVPSSSVGAEGVRSLPPAKTEGAPHRVNLSVTYRAVLGREDGEGLWAGEDVPKGRAPGEAVPRGVQA